MSTIDDLQPHKGLIIREMYLHTADETYITARWCWHGGMITDFFWNAAHALEKYIKAALLMNGQSVKDFSHDLTQLYTALAPVAGPLLPERLTRPMAYRGPWHDMTATDFLREFEENGNADNRYLTYGFAQHAWHLPMLDQMVWSIRRLVVPLDEPAVYPHDDMPAPSNREILERRPAFTFDLMEALEKVARSSESPARHALLNANFAFAPATYPHDQIHGRYSARNPVLLTEVLQYLQSERLEHALHGYRMAQWVTSHMRQSGVLKREIEEAMRGARAAHPGLDPNAP